MKLRMVPRRSYLVPLTGLVLFTLFIYHKTLMSEHAIKRHQETLRQILQFRFNPDNILPTINNESHYIPPVKNYTGSLPKSYLDDKIIKPKGHNETCARYPDLYDIKFKNDDWQMQKTANGTWHVFSAYLDLRNGSVVRVLATYDVWMTTETFYCQFWYSENQKVQIVESQVPLWMYQKNWGADTGYYHYAYLVTCPVIMAGESWPVSVSLVGFPCQNASNNVEVRYKRFETKKDFLVCVKGLSFPFKDVSVRLIEWIELVNLLGAEKIHFYQFNVHPRIKQVLDYYTSKDLVEVTPISLVDDFSNNPLLQYMFLHKQKISRRLQEVIPFNDCLYNHLSEFKYVILLDTDEVIVPVEGTWTELLATLQDTLPGASSFLARNVYFIDSFLHQHDWLQEAPRYMHMLQHVYRTKEYTKPKQFVKGFHDTDKVVALHNHFALACLQSCSDKEIDLNLAHLQHYRADCASGVSDCEKLKANSVADFRVWNYKDELIERVQMTMKKLKLLEE